MRLPVRFTPIFALLLAVASFAPAAEKPEKKRTVENLMEWDLDKTFDTRQSAPFRRSPGIFQSKSASQKDFYYKQKFSPKDFSTRAYSGSKGWWAGDMKFTSKEANTKGKYQIKNSDTKYATPTKATKAARESDKTMATRTDRLAGREYAGRGRSQDRFDKEGPAAQDLGLGWKGRLHEMTLSDIKELLNTNK